MAKIGRNYPCPCGSGKKYKHCCLQKASEETPFQTSAPVVPPSVEISLKAQIARAQKLAKEQKTDFWELGVFLFFTTTEGDAWLLEVTEADAVQVADKGEPMELVLEETKETIAVNWSHTFLVREKQLVLTDYANKQENMLPLAPAQQISASIRRIRKKYGQALLDQVHVTDGT